MKVTNPMVGWLRETPGAFGLACEERLLPLASTCAAAVASSDLAEGLRGALLRFVTEVEPKVRLKRRREVETRKARCNLLMASLGSPIRHSWSLRNDAPRAWLLSATDRPSSVRVRFGPVVSPPSPCGDPRRPQYLRREANCGAGRRPGWSRATCSRA